MNFFREAGIKDEYYILAIVISLVVFIIQRKKDTRKRIAISLIVSFVFLVILSTVLLRNKIDPNTQTQIQLEPFWTYRRIISLKDYPDGSIARNLKREIILNIILTIPFGVLFPAIFSNNKISKTLLTGMAFSCLIESLQLLTKSGLCELDDVIHNTLGVLIGCLIYYIGQRLIQLLEEIKTKQIQK